MSSDVQSTFTPEHKGNMEQSLNGDRQYARPTVKARVCTAGAI